LKSGAAEGEVMTADEGRRSSPDDERPVDDAVAAPPSPSSSDAAVDESTVSPEREDGADESGPTVDEAVGTVETADTANSAPDPVPGRDADESFARRLWTAQSGPLFFLREVTTSVGAVVLVGLILFGISGVWPPMVAVESGSMEPHMQKGDLVFITEPGRYTPDAAYGQTGVVTAEAGDEVGYRTFGGPGSVVVYDDPARGGPPVIHRAEFYVEAGENWYDRADPEFISADSCSELRNCPAPHAGFITKGDANGRYDQVSGIAEPVRPSWITGVARVRIPYLGWVRLGLSGIVQTGPDGVLTADRVVTGPTASGAMEQTSTGPTAPVGVAVLTTRIDAARADVVPVTVANATLG
jgi:signal peptidase